MRELLREVKVKFVEVFRENEESHQFVWSVGKKRYSLEVDSEDAVVFFTHLHTTRIFEFCQIEELNSAIKSILAHGDL